MEKEIRVLMILEIMGRPKELVVESMKGQIEKIKKEEDIKVHSSRIAEPKQIKDKELFSTFAELEVEAKDLFAFFKMIFRYLPSHVEIISPDEMRMRNFDLNTVANEIIKSLHKYDEVVKIVSFEKKILENRLKEASGQDISSEVLGKKEKRKKKSKS